MQSSDKDIAIIGMACLFPKALDLKMFWQNILSKVDAVTDAPFGMSTKDMFGLESRYDDEVYCKRGGFIRDLVQFDPLKYGIAPKTIEGNNPDQYVVLETAHKALEDAGLINKPFNRKKTSVIIGHGNPMGYGHINVMQHYVVMSQTVKIIKQLHPEYTKKDLDELAAKLQKSLPPFDTQTAVGLVPNMASGLTSNRLDLQGVNYMVDAACASSLIAVDNGIQELISKKSDMVIAGGVQFATHGGFFAIFSKLGALSYKNRISPFSKDADGTMLGEGVGMVILKRRKDAEKDGDRIYALIKGSGTASDGKNTAILVPDVEGEVLALIRAYENADISPDSIGLIEAHGTGTKIGDLTEINALKRVFGSRKTTFPTCALGSVKSMISHTIPAAGVAGIIKTSLALYHKILPPTLNCEETNPEFELNKTPFYINNETKPWIHGGTKPRRAGVNAFGFGGINAHIILEEHS